MERTHDEEKHKRTNHKALREQLENDQLNAVEEIAGPAPEILLEFDRILDLVLIARREEIEWVHSEGVYEIVPMQECEFAGEELLNLIWVDTDKSVDPAQRKIDRDCVPGNTRLRSKARFKEPYLLLSCSLQCHHLKLLRRLSVSWSSKEQPLKLRHNDINTAHFQRTAKRLIYIRLPAEDRQEYGEDKVGRLIKAYGTQEASHIGQLDCVTLVGGELGEFRRGTHSAALLHNSNDDVRIAVHGDDSVCLSDEDGLTHIDSLLKSKYTAKEMGTLGFADSDAKRLRLLNRVIRVGTDQTGQFLDIEPDLGHAPLQREGPDNEYTTRETTRQAGVRRKEESDSEGRRCNTTQICVHETLFGPRQIRLG